MSLTSKTHLPRLYLALAPVRREGGEDEFNQTLQGIAKITMRYIPISSAFSSKNYRSFSAITGSRLDWIFAILVSENFFA